MTHMNVNWYQRISLWSRVGSMQTPTLKEAAVCLRILDKVRPTDEEVRATQLTIDGAQYRWTLPAHGYGDKRIELEDEEAKALADGLDNHAQPVTIMDAAWMIALLEQLRAEPASQVVQEVIPAPKQKKKSAA